MALEKKKKQKTTELKWDQISTQRKVKKQTGAWGSSFSFTVIKQPLANLK